MIVITHKPIIMIVAFAVICLILWKANKGGWEMPITKKDRIDAAKRVLQEDRETQHSKLTKDESYLAMIARAIRELKVNKRWVKNKDKIVNKSDWTKRSFSKNEMEELMKIHQTKVLTSKEHSTENKH